MGCLMAKASSARPTKADDTLTRLALCQSGAGDALFDIYIKPMRHTERPQRAPPGETPARTTSDGAVQQQHQPSTFGDRTLVASSAQAGSSRDLSTSLMRRVSSSKGKERADAASPDVAAAAHDTFELDASFKHALSPLSSSRASLASVDRPASAPGAFDLVSEFADRGVRHHGREGNDASPSSPTRSTRLPSPPPKPSYPYLERPDSAPPHATAPGLLSAASTSFSQPGALAIARSPSLPISIHFGLPTFLISHRLDYTRAVPDRRRRDRVPRRALAAIALSTPT